ncbi:hypothetical protein T265_15617, partial [Opisthorchis viverrini]
MFAVVKQLQSGVPEDQDKFASFPSWSESTKQALQGGKTKQLSDLDLLGKVSKPGGQITHKISEKSPGDFLIGACERSPDDDHPMWSLGDQEDWRFILSHFELLGFVSFGLHWSSAVSMRVMKLISASL